MNENIELMMPIKAAPYDHQKKAFAFACDKFGVFDKRLKSRGTALLMEMGTGKTIVSIAVAGCMYQYGKVNRVLVVAPLSILGVWEEEFEKFADFPYSMTILKGTAAKKKEQLTKLPDGGLQVVVVNYESAWRLEKELLAYNADLVIADEAHKLKENRSKQSKGLHTLGDKARFKLLLTGTVITNRELDVFSQYRFLNPQIFGTSFYAFRNQYFDMGGYGNHTPIFRKWMTDDFLKRLHSVAYRVTKAECLDLPAITEEVRTVDLEKAIDHPLYLLLHDEPNPEMSSFVFRETLMTHLLLWGNAYAQIIRNGKGQVVALYPLMPNKMTVNRDVNGQLYYQYQRSSDEAHTMKGDSVILRPSDVLHIPGLGFDGLVGYSPIAMAKNAIGLAIATEEYGSKFFANGAAPSGVLEHPGTIKDPSRVKVLPP